VSGVALVPRILIVDDDEPLRLILQEALSGAGYDVRIAESINSCIDRFDHCRVDLVLTNVGRLRGDELDVSHIQLLHDRAPNVRIIVFTGHVHARRLNLEELGIASVLLKPADLDDLQRLVASLLDGVE
jgi:DNA-binding NtrC family response regulator